jgi:hypothetical protein
MLVREDDRGALVIGQPSHAWLSGQLARAWGNERFGAVEPFEAVCLAAEQHDIGWASRDLEALFNPETGWPHSFMDLPLGIHLELWTDAPRLLIAQSRYAALLVSMHGRRLYQARDLAELPPAKAEAIRRFLGQQEALQAKLLASLQADPGTAASADERLVERNSQLIRTWDRLSLAVCQGSQEAIAKETPTRNGSVDLMLVSEDEGRVWRLDPWPLQEPVVAVHCEGRRLKRRYENEDEMRDALDRAPWETLELELREAS